MCLICLEGGVGCHRSARTLKGASDGGSSGIVTKIPMIRIRPQGADADYKTLSATHAERDVRDIARTQRSSLKRRRNICTAPIVRLSSARPRTCPQKQSVHAQSYARGPRTVPRPTPTRPNPQNSPASSGRNTTNPQVHPLSDCPDPALYPR